MATAFGYTVQTGTDDELLLLYRDALATVSRGQAYQFGDKTLTREHAAELMYLIIQLEIRIAQASRQGPAENVARFRSA